MFLQNMYTAFTQVAILILLSLVGFTCHKGGLFTDKAAKACNGLLFYIVTPAVICKSFLGLERSAENLKLLLWALLASVAFHAFAAVLVHFCFNKSPSGGVYKFASMYGNVGYMGIPLSAAVLGDTGVFICSVVVLVFNIFCFTHGTAVMDRSEKNKINLFKMFVNPGTIGLALGLPLFLFGITLDILPTLIKEPLNHIANLNAPLAMVMLGTYLAATDLGKIFKIPENYFVLLIKLILLPAVMLGASYLLGIRGDLLVALTLMACVPTASNTVMFAAQFGKDTGRAGMTIAFDSVASILTMPVWIAVAQSL